MGAQDEWGRLLHAGILVTQPSEYRVTVSMSGFKHEVRDVTLRDGAGRTARFRAAGRFAGRNHRSHGNRARCSKRATHRSARWWTTADPGPAAQWAQLSRSGETVGRRDRASGTGTTGTTGDRTKNGGGFMANGVRSDQNNFTLDGIDNNSKIPGSFEQQQRGDPAVG